MKKIILTAFFLTFIFSQYEIEGRWHFVGYENNVMYQFVDDDEFDETGYRYTLYSTDGNFGDLEDAGGTPNPYIVEEDVITIDLHFGNVVDYRMNFLCDGQVVEFIFIENESIHSILFREGYNYNNNQNCQSEVEFYSNKDSFLVGEHIEAHFSDLNSYGSDWIGIFQSNASNAEYLDWQYTDGTQINNNNFIESGFVNFSPITLPTGDYELRLFYNNNYELVDSYPFTITDTCIEVEEIIFNDTFKVMTFNTWYSAQYGFGGLNRVAEIIANLNIDVIGFQETDPSSILEIKSLLSNFEGYEQLYSTPSESNVSIISRFPIIDTYDYNLYGIGADLLISNSDTIKFVSSHLTAYPYGPYDLYEGVSVEEVINNELSTRYLENLDIYNQIINNPLNNPNLPIIYVGDHNTPSLLDWGNDNINQNFGFEIDWPVSEFLLNNGFYDSYRQVYPYVNDNIGLTWSPGYPKNVFDSWDVHDRIDMIYFKHGYIRNLYPLESYVYDCDPWPSDHRAVITEFAVCENMDIGDINLDGIINILDITILINELLYSSNLYCIYVYGDFDYNQELNILDIIQLVNIILNN